MKRGLTIIGQAPGRKTDQALPFDGRSGDRLAQLLGMSDTGEMRHMGVILHNLLNAWPGSSKGKGNLFNEGLATRNASRFQPDTSLVLMCGHAVAKACRAPQKISYFQWFPWKMASAAVIPHPSGVNHWWNGEENLAMARQFMTSVTVEAGLLEDDTLKMPAVRPKFNPQKLLDFRLSMSPKLSQEHMAQKLGMVAYTYCRIERGEREPKMSEVIAMTTLLRCGMEDLVD